MTTGRRALTGHALARLLGEWQGSGGPAYEALAERIRVLLLDGRIPVQTWLPAERDLAEVLGRSRTTVISAYRLLREGGYLTSTRGAGSMATLPPAAASAPTLADIGLVDFGKATPPMWPGLPEIYREVAGSFTADGMGSGLDLVGRPELRALIAARYEAQGLPTRPAQIMVTLGAQHAIALCARSLLTRGDRVVVESPTYPHACEALREAGGGRLIPVGVTEEAWDVTGFAAALENSRPTLAYLMPDFHNPTGTSMDAATRHEVTSLAARSGTLLLIDETTRDLAIDPSVPQPPLAAVAPSGAPVVTIGSLGKTVWGGLRLGWIRADEQVISRLATTRASSDLGTPAVEQLVAAEVLPRLPEIIEDRVAQLRAGRDLLGALLPAAFPEWRIPRPGGGLSFWVGLGAPVSSALSLAARARDLVLTAGPRFGIDGAYERNVRIPFTSAPDELRAGVGLLREAWESLPRMAEPTVPAAPVV